MLKPKDLPTVVEQAWKHDEERIDTALRCASERGCSWPCAIAARALKAPQTSIQRYIEAGWHVVHVADMRNGDYFEFSPGAE